MTETDIKESDFDAMLNGIVQGLLKQMTEKSIFNPTESNV